MSKNTPAENWANNKTWSEILSSAGFTHGEPEIISGKKIVERWIAPAPNEETVLVISSEGEKAFLEDDHGSGYSMTKFEVITELHAHGSSATARELVKLDRPLIRTRLMNISYENAANNIGLTPQEMYDVDLQYATEVVNDFRKAMKQALVDELLLEQKFKNEDSPVEPLRLDNYMTLTMPEINYLIDGLILAGSTTTIVAARKTGKTTFIYNLIRSLLTGMPFLGCFDTQKVQGSIAFLNFELTESLAHKWFKELRLTDSKKVYLWNLRGKPNPLRSESSRALLAKQLKAVNTQVLIIDPFSGAYKGDSQSNDLVKEFLVQIEDLKTAAGVSEVIIAVHAGWQGDRSRGASALEDHPDSIVTLTRDETGTRYMRADGRDVSIDETALAFEAETRSIIFTGLSREKSGLSLTEEKILKAVAENPGINVSGLYEALGGSHKRIDSARASLVKAEKVLEVKESGSKKYYPKE
jgi:archaellum biogenesis ATPase FlaH